MPGLLYIVATPIGNLEDLTFRALRVLQEADLIAAEDTRHSRKLLDHYGIKTPLTSYHAHNEHAKAQQLVARMQRGERVALVSDAGTPVLSDPGRRLVQEAIRCGITISPVPGPSALLAALVASALPAESFIFEGFLPAKARERRARLQTLREETRTLVFYEAPHRLRECLADIRDVLGEREVVAAREMTKLHEEFLRGTAGRLLEQTAAGETRGEFTLVVQGASGAAPPSADRVMADIRKLQSEGMRVKDIASLIGEKYALAKRDAYRMVLEAAAKGGGDS